ncbi:MAG: hypothetical protein AAGB06_04985 [Verrucomicrobiota bacterium]
MNAQTSLLVFSFATTAYSNEPSNGTLIMLGSVSGWLILSSLLLFFKARKKVDFKDASRQSD